MVLEEVQLVLDDIAASGIDRLIICHDSHNLVRCSCARIVQ
jgi:hypothetical protein